MSGTVAEPLLRIRELTVEFELRGSLFGRRQVLRAVDGVELDVGAHETLGLVGESGSGKSTIARAVLGLTRASAGSIRFKGSEIRGMEARAMRALRRDFQMVFQDPYSSLDPSHTIEDSVGEPVLVHSGLSQRERRERVLTALEEVGLGAHHLHRYPHEFSGGQRQRIAIARAIILQPSLIVLDEPVSSLDVSTQSQILNLLAELQERHGVSYLFIAHDLPLVRRISHRIAVMYLGKLVETGPSARVYSLPAHPYTAALISAVPKIGARRQGLLMRKLAAAEMPSPENAGTGCRFAGRCPAAMAICRTEQPPLTPVDGGGVAACHLHEHGPCLRGGPVGPWLAEIAGKDQYEEGPAGHDVEA